MLSIDVFRLSPQCGGSAGAVISLTLQWTKYGTRTISLSRKCKLDGRKVRVGARLQMTGVFLARSSYASHSQFERQGQMISAFSLEITESPIQTETSYTHSS